MISLSIVNEILHQIYVKKGRQEAQKCGYNHHNMAMPVIESYQFGTIVIDGRSYTRDVIITPQGVLCPWWRVQGHSLHPEDLTAISELDVEMLIIGQGSNKRMEVPRETLQHLQQKYGEVVCLSTPEACQRYNQERKSRAVIAALHLTC